MSLSPQQRKMRRSGIGSSEAAAAIGVSPFKTPVMLYLEKTGQAPREERETDWLTWGSELEDVVARVYARRSGRKLRRRRPIRSRRFPWMIASLDRTVDGEPVICEIKTTAPRTREALAEWGEPGGPEVPAYILAQCLHQLAVAERYQTVAVPVLFLGDRRLEEYRVERADHERLIDALVEREREFWRRVEELRPPPVMRPADIRALYPRDDGSQIVADAERRALVEELAIVRADQKLLSDQREAIEGALQLALSEAAYLMDEEGRPLATWKTQTSRVVNLKRLEADEPELVERYREERSSRRFLCKVKAQPSLPAPTDEGEDSDV